MATAMPVPSPSKMTFEEFLEWGENVRAEWVDGEVEIMSPVSEEHQKLGGFLFSLLHFLVEEKQAGAVFDQTFVMRLAQPRSGREPDVMFVAAAHLDRIKANYLDGPADLAIEIVSPESQKRDREVKRAEYEQGSVREYWVIDPLRRVATFYQLQADGGYQAIAVAEDGIYRSAVLEDLWINVNWLWQRPLPSLKSIWQQWGLL